ncbi:MAG: 2-hydroxyacyl-CoA dehydratase family protein [Pseudomonadota bacterium]
MSSVIGNAAPAPSRGPEKQLESSERARAFTKQWFGALRSEVIDQRRPYVLSSAEMAHEIFDVLGLPVVTGEWWGGMISAKRMAGDYLDWMNRQGFHKGLGAYNSLGLMSLIADVDNPPWGGLPQPALICAPHREQSAERVNAMVAERLGIPYVGIEMPASKRFYPNWWEMARRDWEDLYETDRIDVVLEQYRELVAMAEQVAGRKLDIDRLRALMERVNQQESNFDQARELIATAPKCPVRLSEQMSNAMTAQWHRGSDWSVEHSRFFLEEVRARVQAGQCVVENEQVRLMWVGVGLWQNTAFYSAFEESHGAVFVWSMYLALAADGYIKHNLRDPLRALAARYCNMGEQAHAAPWAGAWMVHEGKRHRVDGAVMLASPTQRHQLNGNVFQKEALEAAGIPVLEISVDPNDNRGWDEDAMRALVASFIEERIKK